MPTSRREARPLPSLTRLHEKFSYDPETGVLSRKMKRPRVRPLMVTDRLVGVDREHFLVHRVIWKMMTGCDPPRVIDHRDGNSKNNKWENLRGATFSQNGQNSKLRIDNTTGVKGLYWDKRSKTWRAVIFAEGQEVNLGYYQDRAEAVSVITAARTNLHGEFARFQ